MYIRYSMTMRIRDEIRAPLHVQLPAVSICTQAICSLRYPPCLMSIPCPNYMVLYDGMNRLLEGSRDTPRVLAVSCVDRWRSVQRMRKTYVISPCGSRTGSSTSRSLTQSLTISSVERKIHRVLGRNVRHRCNAT